MKFQTIGHSKINQLRHVLFFKDVKGIKEHMNRHAEIMYPKFNEVNKVLKENLEKLGIASWNMPNGGYFINLNVVPGTAKKVVELAGSIGVKVTPAGATYPYGIDPEDQNIRIAPSYPTVEELNVAVNVLCVCIKIAALKKIIKEKSCCNIY